MTDADVIAAIRANHLETNISNRYYVRHHWGRLLEVLMATVTREQKAIEAWTKAMATAENYAVDPHQHIARLVEAGEQMAALLAPKDAAALASPPASDPPGLYRQGQEDMRRRVLDIVRDPSDCRIVKKLPIWGVPGMSEAAAAVASLVERAQQATGGSDASDFRMRQSDPPKTEDEAFDWMVADAARRLGSPAPPASDPPGLVGRHATRKHAAAKRAILARGRALAREGEGGTR